MTELVQQTNIENNEIDAAVWLMSMSIKSVPAICTKSVPLIIKFFTSFYLRFFKLFHAITFTPDIED